MTVKIKKKKFDENVSVITPADFPVQGCTSDPSGKSIGEGFQIHNAVNVIDREDQTVKILRCGTTVIDQITSICSSKMETLYCSECNKKYRSKSYNYCPACGCELVGRSNVSPSSKDEGCDFRIEKNTT